VKYKSGNRKRLLLGKIDVMMSALLNPSAQGLWIAAWLEANWKFNGAEYPGVKQGRNIKRSGVLKSLVNPCANAPMDKKLHLLGIPEIPYQVKERSILKGSEVDWDRPGRI
jgi:hypothetical protein